MNAQITHCALGQLVLNPLSNARDTNCSLLEGAGHQMPRRVLRQCLRLALYLVECQCLFLSQSL